MILGKIKVRIEHFGGHRFFFARPVEAGEGIPHPGIIGVAHVVHLEKSALTTHLGLRDEFECFAIFDKMTYEHQWRAGYTNTKATPIPETVYNELIALYPQEDHVFKLPRRI